MSSSKAAHRYEYPELCAHELVAQQSPSSIALTFGSQRTTYAELSKRSNILAAALRKRGVQKDSFVGVYLRSSPEAVISLLAIFKAGAAFVPIDPAFPEDRCRKVLSDAGVKVLLTESKLGDAISRFGQVETVFVDEDRPGPAAPLPGTATRLRNASCLLYTSGSSGRPKGVVRLHASIVARLAWTSFRPNDVFCHNMSLCYGLSQERLFLPLMVGLPLCILPDDVQKDPDGFACAIEASRVTTVTVVPAFLERLLSLNPSALFRLRSLHTIAVGSAPLRPDLVQRFRRALPEVALVNAYGGTEAGSVARGDIEAGAVDQVVPIGRPVTTAEIHVLDELLRPVRAGDFGELCVGGPSIAQGYWNQPELTRERFVPNPFHSPNDTLYRTGDLGRYLADGTIELQGRADRQVKVRGYRVELEEIETVLLKHEDVADAAVTSVSTDADHRVTAHIAAKSGSGLNASLLREYVRSKLPDYMLPSTFVFVDSIPRTSNGKVDVTALPSPGTSRPNLQSTYVAPRTALETDIASIWAEVLEVDWLGIHDHILDLGGDSLLAARITSELEERLEFRPSTEWPFETPTVAELAAELDERFPKTKQSYG